MTWHDSVKGIAGNEGQAGLVCFHLQPEILFILDGDAGHNKLPLPPVLCLHDKFFAISDMFEEGEDGKKDKILMKEKTDYDSNIREPIKVRITAFYLNLAQIQHCYK